MFAAYKFISSGHSGACSQRLLACFLQASADTSTDAKYSEPKLATLSIQVTLQNTVQTKTSWTLVQIKNFFNQSNQEVMYFIKMYLVFTVTFSRSGERSAWDVPLSCLGSGRYISSLPAAWIDITKSTGGFYHSSVPPYGAFQILKPDLLIYSGYPICFYIIRYKTNS